MDTQVILDRNTFMVFYKICKDLKAEWAFLPVNVVKVALKNYPRETWHQVVFNVFSSKRQKFADLVPFYEKDRGWLYNETISEGNNLYLVELRVWFDLEVLSICLESSLFTIKEKPILLKRVTIICGTSPTTFTQNILEDELSSFIEDYFSSFCNTLLKTSVLEENL